MINRRIYGADFIRLTGLGPGRKIKVADLAWPSYGTLFVVMADQSGLRVNLARGEVCLCALENFRKNPSLTSRAGLPIMRRK